MTWALGSWLQHTKVYRLKSVVHCTYCTQRKSHWAMTLITRALAAPRDSETNSSSQALLRIQTVKVKEDKPCYAPSRHRDISACVCALYVRKVCVRYSKEHIKSSYSTVPRYCIELLLFTFSTVTTSNTHKPTAMKNNAPLSSPRQCHSPGLNATSMSFSASSAVTSGAAEMSKKGS